MENWASLPRRLRQTLRCLLLVGFAPLALLVISAADWPHAGNDPGGMKYSPLNQINKTNVSRLKIAWKYDTGDVSDGSVLPSRSTFEATPLAIDGVLYLSTAFARLIALDAETGKELWMFDPQIDKTIRRNLFVNRGVASWSDGKQRRIYLGDIEGRLWALDAATGKLVQEFGDKGKVNLREGMADGFPTAQYGLTSPVAVCGDVLVAGSLVSDNAPRGPSGDICGLDARTGAPLWRFHTVPKDGEFGADTWEPGSRERRGGTNAWSLLSVDEARGMVFAPLTSPSYDFYGGDRKGANLFGNAVVALDCQTGKRIWHFQTVHHDIWDYDLPAQPLLATVQREGKPVPAVVLVTKMGYVFVLHRETGKPLFPVEERPVPQHAVDGEAPFPTQPVPLKPKPFARQSMRREDLTTVTPESRKECEEMTSGALLDVTIYQPFTEQVQVIFPGLNGGANWGGASFDPHSGVLYVNSMDVGGLFRLVKRSGESGIPYALRAAKREFFWDSNGYPCQQPPWGTLSAIDLNTGDYRWQVRLGEFEELKRRGVPQTGTPNLGGSLVTAGGLVFIAATNDRKFRAFDKDTGKELWSADLPASGFATPITYLSKRNGKQYVAIAAGGGNKYDKKFTGELVAFALEDDVYQGREEKLPLQVAPQPVAFSHKAHAEKAKLQCPACHTGALTADRAGFPEEKMCMACHRVVRKDSPEVRKLAETFARGERLRWVRVYQVPDFVFFSHQEHAQVKGGCESCHGPVATRVVLMKEVSTSMSQCMACHRQENAPTDCVICHQLGH